MDLATTPWPIGRAPVFRRRGRIGRIGAVERVGLVAMVLVALVAILAPLVAPHGATEPVAAAFSPPGAHALLGTDELGRDVLSRALLGVRESLFASLIVVASGVTIGSVVGLLAGISGGVVDTVLMRITDAGLALPGPILAIAIVISLGPSLGHTVVAFVVLWWPYYARLIRGEARALAVRPHVDAARVAGASGVRLALRHVFPGIVGTLLVVASLDIGTVVLSLAELSFLGLGAPPPAPELGAMSAQGLVALLGAPWVPLTPAVAVFVLAVVSSLAGEGIRELLPDLAATEPIV